MHSITFLSGPREGETCPLTDTQILGRSERADLRIDDASVSREHARLTWNGNEWQIVDLGSSNGTRVQGAPATRSVVSSGQVVTLGTVHFRLNQAAQKAKAAGPITEGEITAVGRSAGGGLIRAKSSPEHGGGDDFSQLAAGRKALLILLVILLCAGLFYGAYLLV